MEKIKDIEKQITFQETLDLFIDKLIKEQGVDKILEKDALDELKKEFGKSIMERINIAIVENLPDEKLDEYNEVLSKSQEDQTEFLQKNVPNLDKIIAEEFIQFRALYVKE